MRLIDADALAKKLTDWSTGTVKPIDWSDIAEAPTIDAVEVVRGEWIHNPQIGWEETWLCSKCGEKTTSSLMGKPRYEFCPMCGAKMDGERKESE